MTLRRTLRILILPLACCLAAGCTPGTESPSPNRGAATGGTVSAAATTAAPKPKAAANPTVEDWNDAQIKWVGFDEGLQAAKAAGKPICLVLFTTWCPHCRNYSAVFHNARVVEQARRFVMIRLDKDKNGEISKRYAPDGEYIPRTMFLSSDGSLDESIHAPRPQYKYFYDERNAEGLLKGMEEALGKLK